MEEKNGVNVLDVCTNCLGARRLRCILWAKKNFRDKNIPHLGDGWRGTGANPPLVANFVLTRVVRRDGYAVANCLLTAMEGRW